uniref:Uncharacterized protein n=1 Tax=Anopheles melas TaxID=34690 RepID=A0A182TSV2_9DIPT
MDRRPFLRNRELSELSPLTQSTPGPSHAAVAPGLTRNHSYGSILPYLGFLRNSLRRSASSSNQVHAHTQCCRHFPDGGMLAGTLISPIPSSSVYISARACANNHLPGAAAPHIWGLHTRFVWNFSVFACCPHMGTAPERDPIVVAERCGLCGRCGCVVPACTRPQPTRMTWRLFY